MSGQAATCDLCGASFAPYGRNARTFCKRCAAKADREVAKRPPADCKACGKRFVAASRNARYCSDECRAEGARRRNLEHQRRYMADPQKRAIAMARTRASAAARAARERGGRPPRPQAPYRADPNAEPSTCRLCGRKFAQYGHTPCNAYCKRCTAKSDREVGRTLRLKCQVCGGRFSTTTRSARYCSDECRAESAMRSRREDERRYRADPARRAIAAAQGRARLAARSGGRGAGGG